MKRIESAGKLIGKGDKFKDQTLDLEQKIEVLQNAEGRIKKRKIKKYNKKITDIKIKASFYYKDGYKRYIDVLDDHLKKMDKAGNSEAKQSREDVKTLEKKARKLYNKAENKSSAEKMLALIEEAQANQQQAIELHKKCLISLNEATEEPELIAEASADTLQTTTDQQEDLPVAKDTASTSLDTFVADTNSAASTAPLSTSVSAAPPVAIGSISSPEISSPASNNEALPNNNEVAHPTVFFTIQIMADKQKASAEQLKLLYSGNLEIVEMHVNDWYKYSVGRYQDIEKAKSTLSEENIKGFIVAYNKNQRIPVKEAVAIINGES